MGPVDKLSSANDSAESTGYFARGGQIFVSFKDLSWKKPQPTVAAQPKPPIRGGSPGSDQPADSLPPAGSGTALRHRGKRDADTHL